MNCEIEFLPVGTGSKPGDAIVVRYGDVNFWELLVIDGGTLDSGKELVVHLKTTFGFNVVVTHALVTHPDTDHASGMREILEGLPVENLWVNLPWNFAAEARPYFANKNWTEQGLANELRKEYDILDELVKMAVKKKIPIRQPFAGSIIGPFQVISPYRVIYPFLIPQFDRTPEPDQAAIESDGIRIEKQQAGLITGLLGKAVAKIQNWIPETWENERLKDGGVTSASNESSVVLYGDFGQGRRILLTGDTGFMGLTMATNYAKKNGLPMQDFMFVQIPHHGSRRNVGPSILNTILGPIKPKGTQSHSTAYVSAPIDDDMHPRKIVLNAFIRRGYKVFATQGKNILFSGGFPTRPGYTSLSPLSFASQVEDYD